MPRPHSPRPSVPAPTPDPRTSPLGRFLQHPGQTLTGWVRQLLDLAHTFLVAGWPWLLATVVTVVAAGVVLRRWRWRLLTQRARYVAVLPPPEAELAGATALWANLKAG